MDPGPFASDFALQMDERPQSSTTTSSPTVGLVHPAGRTLNALSIRGSITGSRNKPCLVSESNPLPFPP